MRVSDLNKECFWMVRSSKLANLLEKKIDKIPSLTIYFALKALSGL